ncbi:hypothetical protein TWF679_005681 [Orbilia oligospora]|uniref:Uncharacterized protein n=1 Tax=Orbilia oligospora TaxID=2813651 RepID=A0A8H8VBM0_ORBOL|nr:hypothetical protein TWF679_005681 [Orbilia oligospora]
MADDTMDIDSPNLVAEALEDLPLGTQATVKATPFPKAVLEKLIYSLEEGMDSKALDFLAHVSYTGISTPLKPYEDKKEILIPPADVFSVITNISLHPKYTTRQTGNLETDVAIKASKYLRTLTRIAGATNCDLQTAWQFKRSKVTSSGRLEDPINRRTRNRNVVKTGAVGRKGRQKVGQQDIDVTPFANLDIANEESVFKRCDDIWSVVGWALVCSCIYKKRWDVWRDFLELLIELLTNDFQERIDAAEEDPRAVDLQGSLITAVGFLPDLGGGAGYKRIARAIFANGSEKSRNEWVPVFPKETKKPPKKEESKWASKSILDSSKPRGGSNENVLSNLGANMVDEYHKFRNNVNDNSEAYKQFRDKLATNDFLSGEDDSEEEEPGTGPVKKDDKSKLETQEEALATWGGVEAIIIRLKFMSLLTYTFAHDIPTLSCFYAEFTDTLRLLPIPQLLPFISTSYYPCRTNPSFRGTLLTTILQNSMIFQPRGGWSENTDSISDDTLLHHYFPHAARGNDIESQVRMGNVLEALARLFHVTCKSSGGCGLMWSVEMEEAVEEGIRARREKATTAFRKKRKPTEADKELMKMLGMAEGRLRMLVRIAKVMTLERE